MAPIDKVSTPACPTWDGLPAELLNGVIDCLVGPSPNIHQLFSLASLDQASKVAREHFNQRFALLVPETCRTKSSILTDVIFAFRAQPPDRQHLLEQTIGLLPFPNIYADPIDEQIESRHRPLSNIICSLDRLYIDLVEHHYEILAARSKAAKMSLPNLSGRFVAAAKRCLLELDNPDTAGRLLKLADENARDLNVISDNILKDLLAAAKKSLGNKQYEKAGLYLDLLAPHAAATGAPIPVLAEQLRAEINRTLRP